MLNKISVPIAFVVLCMIGGTTWALQKVGLTEELPLWSAGMRFLIAGGILGTLQLIRKQFAFSWKMFTTGLLSGVFYFSIPFGTVYWASEYVPSGLIAVLASSITVFSLIFNRMYRGVPASNQQKIGVLIAVTGIIVVFSNQFNNGDLIGNIAMFAVLFAMSGSAAVTLKIQKYLANWPLLSFSSVAMISGGFILLSVSLLTETGIREFYGSNLIVLLYLILIGSVVGFTLNVFLVKNLHISKATSHLFISPVIALYVGYYFLHEDLSLNVYLGTIIVMTGVMFINLHKQSKE